MLFFRFLLGVDALAALIVVYFFFIGIADGSVSSFNIVLWLVILAAVAAVIGGGWTLNSKGQRAAANTVLAILAIPALLYGLFILAIVITQPNWQ
jgi:hypothetical protein